MLGHLIQVKNPPIERGQGVAEDVEVQLQEEVGGRIGNETRNSRMGISSYSNDPNPLQLRLDRLQHLPDLKRQYWALHQGNRLSSLADLYLLQFNLPQLKLFNLRNHLHLLLPDPRQ